MKSFSDTGSCVANLVFVPTSNVTDRFFYFFCNITNFADFPPVQTGPGAHPASVNLVFVPTSNVTDRFFYFSVI